MVVHRRNTSDVNHGSVSVLEYLHATVQSEQVNNY
jgi:hypothetical protein